MKKPVIGVVPLWDEYKDSMWMLPGYFDLVQEAGGIPIMLPLTDDAGDLDQLLRSLDGILLTGGHDVSPYVYGAGEAYACECCEQRDRMESVLLAQALLADKPVLGICRGIQFINAALGGTLYQDLPSQIQTGDIHRMKPPYDEAAHRVTVLKDGILYEILGTESLGVNSCHHQAVKELAPGLKACAVSEDGIIEAAFLPDKRFVLGVQWHPEFSWKKDPAGLKIMRSFVRSCRKDLKKEILSRAAERPVYLSGDMISLKELSSEIPCRYLTVQELMDAMIEEIQNAFSGKEYISLKDHCSSEGVLLLDEMDQLKELNAAQEETAALIAELREMGIRVIAAGRETPDVLFEETCPDLAELFELV